MGKVERPIKVRNNLRESAQTIRETNAKDVNKLLNKKTTKLIRSESMPQ